MFIADLGCCSCERENKWLDEVHYAVDSSIIPRGGAKRRKSMQPRALSNVNGTLVHTPLSSGSGSAGRRRSGADWGAMENFRRHSPSVLTTPDGPSNDVPAENARAGPSDLSNDDDGNARNETLSSILPQTPGGCSSTTTYAFNFDATGMSPATPFYLSQRSQLVQQTCPPKQTLQGLFSPAPEERKGDDNGEFGGGQLRFKLEAARRRTLVFKPKIGSPLAQ